MEGLKNLSIGKLRTMANESWKKFADIPTVENYAKYSTVKRELGSRGVVLDFVDERQNEMN